MIVNMIILRLLGSSDHFETNTWTNMIVKMIILRLLGSSDDKEKEKIGVARPEEPTHKASVHPMVVGRTDAMTEGN